MSTSKISAFDPGDYLTKAGLARKIVKLRINETLFSQGEQADSVFYLKEGKVKLTVLSANGKEAVLALLGEGDFVGEDSIPAPHTLRVATATALTPCTLMKVGRKEMVRIIHEEHSFSDLFVGFLLARTMRIQADLVDQLFNSSEKRLARILLVLAQFGKSGKPETTLPKISQETLAEMVGTTRSRVSFFMNRFRKLGFIDYNGSIQVHPSLLNIVLHD